MSRILVVDDDPAGLILARAALRAAGHEVTTIQDARQAETALSKGGFDAVVLDVIMPHVSGLEVVDRLRRDSRTQRLPVLLVSGRGDSAARTRGLRQGADDYLPRPYDPAELALRIERLLEGLPSGAGGLWGRLEEHALSETLQGLEAARKSGAVHVYCGRHSGEIRLSRGEIASARHGALEGRDAVLAMLAESSGGFRFDPEEAPAPDGQHLDLRSLLLEAAVLDDELTRRAQLLPAEDEPLQLAGHPAATLSRQFPDLPLAAVAEHLRVFPGITLCDLLRQLGTAPQRVRLCLALLIEGGHVVLGSTSQ